MENLSASTSVAKRLRLTLNPCEECGDPTVRRIRCAECGKLVCAVCFSLNFHTQKQREES